MFCTSSSGSSFCYFKCKESAKKPTLMFVHLSITQLPTVSTITHLVTAELCYSLNNIKFEVFSSYHLPMALSRDTVLHATIAAFA